MRLYPKAEYQKGEAVRLQEEAEKKLAMEVNFFRKTDKALGSSSSKLRRVKQQLTDARESPDHPNTVALLDEVRSSPYGLIADSGIHRYGTRRNQQRAMEGLQAELAEMRIRGSVPPTSGGLWHEPCMDPMFRRLEERLKAVEGQNTLGVDVADLGLVPGVRVQPKFRVPVFDKYNGNSCPKTHVQAYFRKMVAYSDDEKLLMYFFQNSLARASLEWYMRLDRAHIRCWRDLAEAFVK
ncbi:hypothetical protein KIW84_073119 [Lathyrus oleraceus]|uniref:Retrotransposon gag domain-containing protein n=1 Tax=Pisum sativum TaxID=3888 RepID=A0A9D4VQD6_PEA|nr:hypothetical protein KIW84_073119 [Pisum sativum]